MWFITIFTRRISNTLDGQDVNLMLEYTINSNLPVDLLRKSIRTKAEHSPNAMAPTDADIPITVGM